MGGGTLVIVCGLPGAGKTTLARKIERERAGVRLCPDEWLAELALDARDEAVRDQVERLQWVVGRRLLELGQTVVVEWGTWGRGERDRLRKEARHLRARVELVYLSAPPEELFRRIQARAMEQPPIRWQEVQAWAARIEVPGKAEGALFDHFAVVKTG